MFIYWFTKQSLILVQCESVTLLVGTKSWFADPASATLATNEREERKRRGKREHMKRRREENSSMLPILGFQSIGNIFSNSWKS